MVERNDPESGSVAFELTGKAFEMSKDDFRSGIQGIFRNLLGFEMQELTFGGKPRQILVTLKEKEALEKKEGAIYVACLKSESAEAVAQSAALFSSTGDSQPPSFQLGENNESTVPKLYGGQTSDLLNRVGKSGSNHNGRSSHPPFNKALTEGGGVVIAESVVNDDKIFDMATLAAGGKPVTVKHLELLRSCTESAVIKKGKDNGNMILQSSNAFFGFDSDAKRTGGLAAAHSALFPLNGNGAAALAAAVKSHPEDLEAQAVEQPNGGVVEVVVATTKPGRDALAVLRASSRPGEVVCFNQSEAGSVLSFRRSPRGQAYMEGCHLCQFELISLTLLPIGVYDITEEDEAAPPPNFTVTPLPITPFKGRYDSWGVTINKSDLLAWGIPGGNLSRFRLMLKSLNDFPGCGESNKIGTKYCWSNRLKVRFCIAGR